MPKQIETQDQVETPEQVETPVVETSLNEETIFADFDGLSDAGFTNFLIDNQVSYYLYVYVSVVLILSLQFEI